MSKVRLYGSIEKVDEQEDGTLIVSGVASTEEVDSQGEIVTRAAMSNAIPEYMKFGAVREMHQPMAAGTALKCSVDEAGVTHLEAHIVDPVAVKKVLAQVYKGFSIGGKVKSRDEVNKNTITGLKLTEISLVDVPANPNAVFSLGKLADDDGDEVEKKGARFSKSTKTALSELHKAVKSAKEHLDSLGYEAEEDGEESGKADNPFAGKEDKKEEDEEEGADPKDPKKKKKANPFAGKEDKAEEDKEKAEQAETLQKLHTDTVAKVDALTAELAKAADEKAELLKQIEALKALPAAPKGNVTAVTKSGDSPAPGAAKEVEPIRKGDGSIDEVATLIKATHISAISAPR